MRSLITLIISTILVLFFSCTKTNIDNSKIALYHCNLNKIEPYLCFDSVVANSLCPENAICIWSGYAMIKVSFHENGNTHNFKMILPNIKNLGAVNDTIINGYKIVFSDLKPNPNTSKPAPLPSEIYATILITH